MLYHGTVLGGLQIIKANAHSHTTGSAVAYFTEDRCYALTCCRTQAQNFVTMGLQPDGKQHYYERFPQQLKTLYAGKRGYLYSPVSSSDLVNTKGRTWESNIDVPVFPPEVIEDVYAELLKEEAAGRLLIHRYNDIDPVEQKLHANYIRDHLDNESPEMQQFYLAHFSSLWD